MNDVFHDGTDFVSVGATVSGSSPARPTILVSGDGITWAEASSVADGTRALNTVLRAGDGLWLAAGDNGSIYVSGTSSVSAPAVSGGPGPTVTQAVGGTATFTFTVTGSPTPTYQWLKDGLAISNGTTSQGSTITGANAASLLIANLKASDRGSYTLKATNSAGSADSPAVALDLTFAQGGAVLIPYGRKFTEGGKIVSGASPARTVISGTTASTFSPHTGIVQLPGTSSGGADYRFFGGINPSGTKIVLFDVASGGPSLIYDLASNTSSGLPTVPVPIGSIATVADNTAVDIADNGDFTGAIEDGSGVRHGYHYSATAGTYTLLGNIPNSSTDPSTNPEAISADGASIAGYERVNDFDGAFLWTTPGAFTLLEAPSNASTPDGDIRAMSANGRFIVGLGADSAARGGGSTAMRWDRGPSLGFPTGLGLARATNQTFSDAFTVNNIGTTGGLYRRSGGQYNDTRAAIWLADGSIVDLNEYLLSEYGLDTGGFHLSLVTSISDDGKTLAGNSLSSSFESEGWMLTLPEAIDTGSTSPTAAQIALEAYLSFSNVPSNLRGPLDDPDYDGLKNLVEFALGLPAMSYSALPIVVSQGGLLSVTYTRAQQSHVTYTVKLSTDLGVTESWTASGVIQGTPDENGVTTASALLSGTLLFLRVEVSLNP